MKESVLSNYTEFELDIFMPDDVDYLLKAWGLTCQNTCSPVKSAEEEDQRTHLYLVK